VLERPGADVLEDPLDASAAERVELQRDVLIGYRHSGVANDLVAHRVKPSQNPRMGLRHPPRFRASVSRGPLSLLALCDLWQCLISNLQRYSVSDRGQARTRVWRIRGRSACWPWHLLRADGGAPLGLREVLSSEASPGYLAGGVILGACWRARAMLVIAVSAIAAMPISAAVV
jgi:hypothetical protein